MKVKIVGAGSVGNHFAHAARKKGWPVLVCDTDPQALTRMRAEIYPQRYGTWDDEITLTLVDDAPGGGFDLIIVGTPPDTHLQVAKEALAEGASWVLIEKPLLPPSPAEMQELGTMAQAARHRILVGYNHLLSPAISQWTGRLGEVGRPLCLDVAFREHWQGIFDAHPWLSGPSDSYLGFTHRGGGASGEHSHALSLWLHLAEKVGAGKVIALQAFMDQVEGDGAAYDRIFRLTLKTESGLTGSVVQDVVTWPAKKWARLQGAAAAFEFEFEGASHHDRVVFTPRNSPSQSWTFPKNRPDEFIRELDHIEMISKNPSLPNPLSLEHGLAVIQLLVAAGLSAQEGRAVLREEFPPTQLPPF
jgi:predicted dehydrogenase